jgi:cystathionine beta-synthase
MPYDNVLQTIGQTPLIRLHRVTDGARTPVYGKAEMFNPGGSVKDRISLAIIEAAEESGDLRPGGTIVEGTSGNTGVALAVAAAVKGYRCIFTIPDKMSTEKVRLLKAFGAEVIVTPSAVPPDHPDYYNNLAKRIAEETPNAILADQFYNPVNPQAHYETTGPEVWEQTEGRITHFIASPGTGGTISGAARYLKEQNPEVRIIAGDPIGSIFTTYHRTGHVEPGAPYKVEGIGNDKIPTTLHFDLVDEFRQVCDRDAFHMFDLVDEFRQVCDRDAFHMARRVTREEGLFSGGSTGLIVKIAVDVAREVDDPEACVVCILCDTGERYLSKVYNDEWMAENRMFRPARVTAAYLLESKADDTPLVSVGPRASVREALDLIEEHNVSQLPVLEEGRPVGSVNESALLGAVMEDPARLANEVREVADEPFPVVDTDAELSEITSRLTRQNPAILVAENGSVRGILTRYDVIHHLIP